MHARTFVGGPSHYTCEQRDRTCNDVKNDSQFDRCRTPFKRLRLQGALCCVDPYKALGDGMCRDAPLPVRPAVAPIRQEHRQNMFKTISSGRLKSRKTVE